MIKKYILGIIGFTLFPFLSSSQSHIIISEVFYDTPLYENDNDDLPATHNGEFIELYNPTDQSVNISGYSLYAYPHHLPIKEHTIIKPNDYLLICFHSDKETSINVQARDSAFMTFGEIFPEAVTDTTKIIYQNKIKLKNTGQNIYLTDKNFKEIDRFIYNSTRRIFAHNGYNCWKNLRSVHRMLNGYYILAPTPGKIDLNASQGNIFEITEATTKFINPELAVGNFAGVASVSPSGGASYNIPIDIPAGIAGMNPQLSIQYNSQGGSGCVGKKWDLAGISSITRVAANLQFDSKTRSISFTPEDGFILNGQRLIYKGKNEYICETNPQLKITSDGKTFRVVAPDGVLAEYGSANNSSVCLTENNDSILSYKLHKICDLNGNYIEYFYENFAGENVINKIKYTGNSRTGSEGIYTVVFIWKTRTERSRPIIIGRRKLQPVSLLTNIYIKDDTGKQRESYDFSYTEKDPLQRDLLCLVQRKNEKRERLNEIVISWNNEIPTLMRKGPRLPVADLSGYWTVGDVNVDGISDAVNVSVYHENHGISQKNKLHITAYHSNFINRDIWFPYHETFEPMPDFFGGAFMLNNPTSKYRDIVVPVLNHNFWALYFYRWTPSGLQRSDSICYVISTENKQTPVYSVGDFNNDGLDDFVISCGFRSIDGNTINTIRYFIRKPDGRFKSFSFEGFNSGKIGSQFGREVRQLFISDFNKDGLADLGILTDIGLHFYKNTSILTGGDPYNVELSQYKTEKSIHSKYDVIRAGDFNGDGLLDFIYNLDNSELWKLALNDGAWSFQESFLPLETIHAYEERISDNDNKDAFYVYDFDGDGLDDLVYWDAEYSNLNTKEDEGVLTSYKLRFLKSRGTRFECVKDISEKIKFGEDPFRNSDLIGDFNGDGVREFVTNLYGQLTDGYTIPENITHHTVSDIASGMNQRIHFEYQSLARNFNHFYSEETKRASYPVRDLHPLLTCLRSMTIDNPGQKSEKIVYTYQGAKMHEIIGFLGFEGITSTNELTNTEGSTSQEFSREGWLNKQILTQRKNNNPVSESIQKFSHVLNIDKSRMSYISESTETDFLTGTQCLTQNTYNHSTGNLIKQEQKYDDNIVFTSEYADFVFNKPSVTTISKKYPNAAIISEKMTQQYDERGNLLQSVNYADTDKAITTLFGNYTTTGQPGWKEVKAGAIIQKEEYTYDFAGRMTERKDFLGKTTFEYDNFSGNLLSTTTPNGLTETNSYDSWGNLSSFTDYLGNTTTYKKEWALSENDSPAILKEIEQKSGHSPVTTWYDALERKVKTESYTGNNLLLEKINKYDDSGNLINEISRFGGEITRNDSYKYDLYNRLSQNTNEQTGKVVTYSRTGRSETTLDDGKSYTRQYNSQGNLLSATSPGGKVGYTYNSFGLPEKATAPQTSIRMSYDLQGNRTAIRDEISGILFANQYDTFGNLTHEQDSENNITTLEYDSHGRLSKKSINNQIIAQYQYETQPNGLGKVSKISGADPSIYQLFEYNRQGQMISSKLGMGSEVGEITFTYGYNADGKLTSTIYPGNITIKNSYIQGDLKSVTLNNLPVWKNNKINARSIWNDLGNGATTSLKYDEFGNLTSIEAVKRGTPLLNYQYNFDPLTGLLQNRTMDGISETFSYDNQHRITGISFPNDSTQVVNYDENRIDYKTGSGKYIYDGMQLKALLPDSTTTAALKNGSDSLAYTPFGNIAYIRRDNYYSVFTYGPDEKRICMKEYRDNKLLRTTYYAGLYEWQIDSLGNKREISYIQAGNDMPAIFVKENTTTRLYFLYSDHLGSITAITDAGGKIIARYHYGAWGNKELVSGEPFGLLSRGFTGHEQLAPYGLINMNGRLYDPELGLFLSQDNFVQLSDNVQNYNRYSYCLNNPLHLTDPSGQVFGVDDLVIATAIAAFVGGTANVISNWDNIEGFWQGFTSFFVGGSTAALTVASGGIAGISWIGVAGVGAAGGAITGGTNSVIAQTGKNFKGIDRVNWNNVAINSCGGMVAGGVGSGIGYYCAVNPTFTLNKYNITSPILKTTLSAPLPAAGSHITGGMTTGLLSGKSWDKSWKETSNTLARSVATSTLISISSTTGMCVVRGYSPINGRALLSGYPDPDYQVGSESNISLEPGIEFDRYGEPTGKYGSPAGTVFPKRSLAPASEFDKLHLYKVIKSVPVQESLTAPAFGQPGGGIQYKFEISIQNLINNSSIIKIQ